VFCRATVDSEFPQLPHRAAARAGRVAITIATITAMSRRRRRTRRRPACQRPMYQVAAFAQERGRNRSRGQWPCLHLASGLDRC
jgi:hypothetical protein